MLQSKQEYYYNEAEELFLWDYLVLDEASMIDLSLMKQLLAKTHLQAQLVLVGIGQLHPIEVGYFFFDLCQTKQKISFFLFNSKRDFALKL